MTQPPAHKQPPEEARSGQAPDVDARDLRCPLPVIRLAAASKDLEGGMTIAVLTTDPAARFDVPAWARMRGHVLIDQELIGSGERDGEGASPHLRSTVQIVRTGPVTCP